MKGPGVPDPPRTAQGSGAIMDLVAEQMAKCVSLWVAEVEPNAPRPCWESTVPSVGERSHLPLLLPSQIKAAAASFKVATSSTYDGFHLRHFGLLSDEALEVLAVIWAACESSALVPPK